MSKFSIRNYLVLTELKKYQQERELGTLNKYILESQFGNGKIIL